jgi:hypothetical protein
MAQIAPWSVQIYVNGKLWRRINNVRDNGRFRALKRYLHTRGINKCIINYYLNGVFQYQEKHVES